MSPSGRLHAPHFPLAALPPDALPPVVLATADAAESAQHGEILAKAQLFIFFTGLIQKFEIKLANEEDVPSTKYRPGITLSPYPFKIRFIARN